MFLSLLFSVFTVTEHLCVKREGCVYNICISQHSKVNCAMVGGKTKRDIALFTVGVLSMEKKNAEEEGSR